MSDKIISFPLRSNIPLTEELLQEWKRGLASKDYQEQWRTFERMSNFSDIHVLHLVQDFLQLETGEALLKTKLLQTLKNTCPSTLSFQVKKGNQEQTIHLAEVPVNIEDWEEEYLQPLKIMEEKAYADPSLIELARDLWLFFLEKHYPFQPELGASQEWSAGLHTYTLATMNEELANWKIKQDLPELYGFTPEKLVQFYQRLASSLS